MTGDETLEVLIKELQSSICDEQLIHPKKRIGFMIGTTVAQNEAQMPYKMPLRQTDEWVLFGIVVFSQTQAIVAAHLMDGIADAIFVDSEKKLPVRFEPDYTLLVKYGLKNSVLNSEVEFGNISAACQKTVTKSEYYNYKANDLTVDAVFYYLSRHFRELSGKKIVIYGTGNNGNKLALKLVESGAHIFMCSKRPQRAIVVIDALNEIKSKFALSSISLAYEPLFASHDADAIIGCTTSTPVISKEMATVMKSEGIIVDLGKGTIEPEAVKLCNQRGIHTWLVDAYATIVAMLVANEATNTISIKISGRKQIDDGLFFVAGGHIGEKYDVIVDNLSNPSKVIGVCGVPGRVMTDYDELAKQKLASAEFLIKNKRNI